LQAYLDLEKIFSRSAILSDIGGLLSWDMETIMPDGAIEGRTRQLATLSRLSHELLLTNKTAELLEKAKQETAQLSAWQKANLREMQHTYIHASALPAELVEKQSQIISKARQAWIGARKNDDFASILPHLSDIVRIQQEVGQAIGGALGLNPYDALIDQYDPGGRQAKIDPLFNELQQILPLLIDEGLEKQKSLPSVQLPKGPFPIDLQKKLAGKLAETLGFDPRRGRLDISTHPFCGGASGDVRITTRYDEQDFISAMMGIFHETGHAIYEQNRPQDWYFQPVGTARGMAIHESQSLIFEKQACRTKEFIEYFAEQARMAFNGSGPAWTAENIYRLAIRVERGFIRVDADELTYPAHIIVRYDLEKAMINGDLQPKDLPSAFNEGIKKILGLKVPDNRRGCLQDPHWYSGSFGYFPSYTLGAMIAAQLFAAACNDNRQLLMDLGKGNFTPFREWLNRHVHQKASLLSEDELIKTATGQPLDPKIYLNHLRWRYIENAS
jgi:carboxypeptidase Taq